MVSENISEKRATICNENLNCFNSIVWAQLKKSGRASFSRMFSGLRSQWIMRCLRRNCSERSSCPPNRRIKPSETPWKLFDLPGRRKPLGSRIACVNLLRL